MIAAGLGIEIMPEWQDIPGVVYIPIADLPLHRTIGLVWRTGQDSQVSDRFRAFAASHDWQR